MPPGFNETNESIDNFISNQLSTELISSAVSVADLERQLVINFILNLTYPLKEHEMIKTYSIKNF